MNGKAARVKETLRKWRLANPDKVREQTRRQRETRRRYLRNWRAANPERNREFDRAHYWANREKIIQRKIAAGARRRATEGEFSPEDVERMTQLQDERCAYCSEQFVRLTVDHVIPVARGGSSWPSNLVMACFPCNSSKGSRLLSEWRPS